MQYQLNTDDVKAIAELNSLAVSKFPEHELKNYEIVAARVRALSVTGTFVLAEDDAKSIINFAEKVKASDIDVDADLSARLDHLIFTLKNPMDKQNGATA